MKKWIVKYKKPVVIILILCMYFTVLTLVSFVRTPPAGVPVGETLIGDGEMAVSAGDGSAWIDMDGLHFNDPAGTTKIFSSDLPLSDIQQIMVHFYVNCPGELDKPVVLRVDLCAEGYDSSEQEFAVSLKAGQNEVSEVIHKGNSAPEVAKFRIFCLDAVQCDISGLSVQKVDEVSHGSKSACAVILIVLAVLLLLVISMGRENAQIQAPGDRKYPAMSERKKDILTAGFVGVLSIVGYCLIAHIWNVELSVPLNYGGDVSGLLTNIKSVLREESWWNFTGLGAPFHTNMWRALMDAYIPNAIIFAIAKVTNSVGYGLNLYYILSYGLSGVCAYYMLRCADVKREFSVVGAVLYALIPGHLQRSENHIYVGSCFAIPLIIVAAKNVMEGRIEKKAVPVDIQSAKKKLALNAVQLQGICFLCITALCTIYYGVFAMMLLTFCFTYYIVANKDIKYIRYYFQYVFAFAVCAALIYAPQILANAMDPRLEDVSIVTRNFEGVETFSGKLIQYILPVTGHRIGILAALKNFYNSSAPLINENDLSALGLIMSAGFLSGLLACFFPKEKWAKSIEIYGKMELFMFFTSTVGGLGSIVGIINYSIRCYNRFSYFIGAAAIIISAKALQMLCEQLAKKVGRKQVQRVVTFLVCLAVLTVGILDQTTPGMAYTKVSGEARSARYTNDEQFVQSIEAREGDNASILVFPAMNGQESAIGYTKSGHSTRFYEQLPFVHSSTSSWSTGSKPGEAGERWLNWLRNLDVRSQIKAAAAVGFSGIAICYNGYAPEELEDVLAVLNDVFGGPSILHENGDWAYYSFHDSKDLLAGYSDEERENLKSKYLYDYGSWGSFDSGTLYSSDESSQSEEIALMPEDIQYGPYYSFSSGLYEVEIFGENLDQASFDCVSKDDFNYTLAIEKLSSQYAKYWVTFASDVDEVEFRTFNGSEETVTVKQIEVNQVGEIDTSGIWAQEPWGRWAEKECAVIYDNQGGAVEAELYLWIATPAEDGATVTVSCGGYSEEIVTNGQTEARLHIPLEPGKNEIKLSSSAPDVVAPADPRDMNISIYDMMLVLDGKEIKISSPR